MKKKLWDKVWDEIYITKDCLKMFSPLGFLSILSKKRTTIIYKSFFIIYCYCCFQWF